jgi:endonuclease/exonuclease/phosphatase family metal-dependent hydrolase
MKLIQFNAWGGRLEKQVADLLQTTDPDLVCLQEIISTEGDAALAIPLETLQSQLSYSDSYMSPAFSFNLLNKKAYFGNAVLSRLPLTNKETIFTNLQYKEDFDFDSDDYNIRNLQHVVVAIGDKQLHLLNHHGHHIRQHKNGDDETLRQTKQIAEYLRTLDGPIILTGDFNLAPDSESLEQINSILTNLPAQFGLQTTRTELTTKTEVCDYIFVNDSVTVNSFGAIDKLASDHKALILEFDI